MKYKKPLLALSAITFFSLTACVPRPNVSKPTTSTLPSSGQTKASQSSEMKSKKITDRTDPKFGLEEGVPTLKAEKLTSKEQTIFENGDSTEDMALIKKFATQSPKQDPSFQNTVLENNENIYKVGGYFRSQEINKNPWYWIYLMRNERDRFGDSETKLFYAIGNRQYLRGYLDAFYDSQNGEDHTNEHERNTYKKGVYRSVDEHLDYVDGYKDGMKDYLKN